MAFLDKILAGNTLYYPGCLTKFVGQDIKKRYEKILNFLKIDFIQLSELESCCGSPVLKAGYFEDFKKLAEKNLLLFKEHGVKKIITNCPACFMILKKYYQETLKEKWTIEVEHITQTIIGSKIFKNLKINLKNQEERIATYHDPCHLGRQMGVYQEPREILRMLGYKIKEMELSRKESFCCGAGGGVKNNEPELANEIAKERIRQAKETGSPLLVTACPLCYFHLKENAQNIEVKELSELLEEFLEKND